MIEKRNNSQSNTNPAGTEKTMRRQAEETLRQRAVRTPVSPDDAERLLHELEVHQIELEMQNDELRRAQVELEAVRARYFDLYDLAPVGYFTLNEKGLILEVNLTACSLLGMDRKNLVRQPLSRFILAEDTDICYLNHKKIFATGEPLAFEIRMLRQDGAPFWVHMVTTVAQDSDGAPVCRAVIDDITGRKQLEHAQQFLLECGYTHPGENFFQSLAKYLAGSLQVDFVCIDRLEGEGLNATTVAVCCDGAFLDNITYALKDTPCGAVVGKTICCFEKDVCRLFPRDEALQELRAESYAGTTLWSNTGKPIGLIAVIARHPLANPRLAETLLKLVAVRAAGELERRQAEEALLAKNAELERFTRAVSHDLKSPLVTIRAFLGHLEKDLAAGDKDRIAQDLSYVHSAAEKMNALLDELLKLSQVGQVTNPCVEAPLQELAQEALALVAGKIDKRGVRVTVTKKPVMLYGDRVRLVEVFQNLMDNAVKFMGDQSEPLIELGAEAKQNEIVCFVRDNGMGIDPRHMNKLFGLFEKLNSGMEGSGLGLALVKRIIELHGGRIWVESEGLGKGACFWFSLPGKQVQG